MKNKIVSLNRRRFLIRAAELGTLIIASPLSIAAASNAFTKTKTKKHRLPQMLLVRFINGIHLTEIFYAHPEIPDFLLNFPEKFTAKKDLYFTMQHLKNGRLMLTVFMIQ